VKSSRTRPTIGVELGDWCPGHGCAPRRYLRVSILPTECPLTPLLSLIVCYTGNYEDSAIED